MEGRADKSKYEEKGVEDETGLRDIVVESDDEKEKEKEKDEKKKKDKGQQGNKTYRRYRKQMALYLWLSSFMKM